MTQAVAPSDPAAPTATMSAQAEVVPVLDFGSQYTQLICRRVREAGVYSEMFRPDVSIEELRKLNPVGVILSGGPSSVYEKGAPRCDPRLFELGVPVLGICYGLQLGAELLGAKVHSARPQRIDLINDSTVVDVRYVRSARRSVAPVSPAAYGASR